ncbi:uncharacterized protein LOC118556891 [Fundulus heteroclitus]|uniref:uncharacterized protein LOC118556891 n=1 Tax=Fundulus heteroclitus TaxID=8078 RepID=UPI00165CA378|nr:uncharacterized protein LOC118556891 [Fundulus heteroclitus]
MDIHNKKEKKPYRDKLNKDARDRYLAKLTSISNIDPYELAAKAWTADPSLFPPTTNMDIIFYLVNGVSAYTLEEFRNYKSLEAHGLFTNGWVQDLYSFQPEGCTNTVVTAKVMHSQRLREAPLNPWAIIESSGAISSAHCTCMAGIGESCTHVAAMLFKLEVIVRCRETVTVTGRPAYWMIPGNLSKVVPEPGYKIDFTSSKAKRKTLNRLLEGGTVAAPGIRTKRTKTSTVSNEQLDSFFRAIHKASPQAAMLSCLPEYCEAFIDQVQPFTVPRTLHSLRDATMDGKDISVLRKHCESLVSRTSLSNKQAEYIECNTRKQNKSLTWHHYRAGRVTASNMHSVYVANLDKPSQSVINAVCYPTNETNSSSAIAWGRQNEDGAREMYRLQSNRDHVGFEVTQCGFFVNPKFPEVGASPDGLVHCICCGRGCIEIKCSYKYRDLTVIEACNSSDRNFCLELQEGEMRLKPQHPYYKQVQTQIFVTETEYCDFVMWTKKDLAVIRVAPDLELWTAILEKAKQFFVCVSLPELVSCHFTKTLNSPALNEIPLLACNNKTPQTSDTVPQKKCKRKSVEKLWCTCRCPESKDNMVACDNDNCKIVWFHLSCVGLQLTPAQEETWFCSSCTNKM